MLITPSTASANANELNAVGTIGKQARNIP